MPTWLIVVLAVLAVLVIGGAVARRRQLARTQGTFERRLARADQDLAAAAAQDRGWDRDRLEAAAREAFAARGGEPEGLVLVEVLDRPGTDEDEAVFEARVGGRPQRVVLGRRAGEWVPAGRG